MRRRDAGQLRDETGSLDNVKRIVKVAGYVNATPEFIQQPAVVNGASDLLAEVFGEEGKHARAASASAACQRACPSKWS